MRFGIGIGICNLFNGEADQTGPSADTAPSVAPGSAVIGTQETRTQGTYSATGGGIVTVTTQSWRVDGVQVATGATYTPVEADDGGVLTYFEEATESGGTNDGTTSQNVSVGTIAYAQPVASGALADQSFTENTGNQTYDPTGDFSVSGDADLSGVTWSLPTTISGVTINSSTGLITFDTNVLAIQTGTSIVVRATNSGGFANSGFSLNITEADATAPTIDSATWTASTQTLDVTVTEVGPDPDTVDIYVTSYSGAAPSDAQVKAGTGGTILEDYNAQNTTGLTGQDLGFTATSDGTNNIAIYVEDDAGNSARTNITGVLLDATAPTLVPASCTPADGATGVAIDSNITLIFSETVVAGSGNFYIYEDGVLSETIAVGSTTIGTTDVVINPVSDFTNNVDVSVRWDAGVVEDQQGNAVAANATDTLLNFQSAAASGFSFTDDFNRADQNLEASANC